MTIEIGSLVRARHREWVVLPDSDDEMLVLQPVTGADRNPAGILRGLEPVEPATFPLPDPDQCGDLRDWRLLRDAVRIGFRGAVGPFRSLAKIAVAPRAYQLVPLMMALRLDPVRLLIADDVGIGKTIESLLIATELLEQRSIRRMAVLCSPALAEQWQREMSEKFHIDAELVLPSTASRLERRTALGQSIFDRFPFVVISTDYIKSEVRRLQFLDQAPELIIVDEAHTSSGTGASRGATQRYELVKGLADDPNRHMLLLTATPHSGKPEAFRNLLSFLDDRFTELPEDLSGHDNEPYRRDLARHFVQRRRADVVQYDKAPFPDRIAVEANYRMTDDYRRILNRVVTHARETVLDEHGRRRRRVQWWSVLAIFRALASSPPAAAATLRNRASTLDAATDEEVEAIGRADVLDLSEDETLDDIDVIPGGDASELADDADRVRRRLRDLARDIEKLEGPRADAKLKGLFDLVDRLLGDDHAPIVFCRFIATAEYVADQLRNHLGKRSRVEAVTGTLPAEERAARVRELGEFDGPRVLVATDCLSEGVNLQERFDAVVHYDLSWNPTRHEQREGRVDRYGQPSEAVRTITYYGVDNGIDGIVLDVLLRKHDAIRKATGVSIPVPGDADGLIETVMNKLILDTDFMIDQLQFFEDDSAARLHGDWDDAAEREKASRSMFAQHAIKPTEVQAEVDRVRAGLGDPGDLHVFLATAIPRLGGAATASDGALALDLEGAPASLVDVAPDRRTSFPIRVELPVQEGETYVTRTHPFVEAVAALVLEAALGESNRVGRCGFGHSRGTTRPTVVALVRHRVLLTTSSDGDRVPSLAEHCEFLAIDDLGDHLWLTDDEIEALIVEDGLLPVQANGATRQAIDRLGSMTDALEVRTGEVAQLLVADHVRVRQAARHTGVRHQASPAGPPDVLGVYVLQPGGTG